MFIICVLLHLYEYVCDTVYFFLVQVYDLCLFVTFVKINDIKVVPSERAHSHAAVKDWNAHIHFTATAGNTLCAQSSHRQSRKMTGQ